MKIISVVPYILNALEKELQETIERSQSQTSKKTRMGNKSSNNLLICQVSTVVFSRGLQ